MMSEMVSVEVVAGKIFVIRGEKVMLDKDLAELYEVETGQLKRAVRRNIDRFPDDFMFELNNDEFKNLRCQIGTSSWGGIRYAPMAFTEPGVAMLSSVLKSKRAIHVNIQIMRVFIKIRQMVLGNDELRKELEEFRQLTDEKFMIVFETLDQLLAADSKSKKKIGFTVKEKIAEYGFVKHR